MLQTPVLRVTVEPALRWSVSGPMAERALAMAQRLTADCHHLNIEAAPPAHTGFGTGTALALALGKALLPDATTAELARLTGRGQRSGVGLYGFDHGGFIVDAGKVGAELPLLAGRYVWPADWYFVVFVPDIPSHWSGEREREAFTQQRHASAACQDIAQQLHGLLQERLLPALVAHDYPAFASALYDYNHTSGELFAPEQGGTYAHPEIARLITWLRAQGVVGVGQSSWGPAVFAVCPTRSKAESVLNQSGCPVVLRSAVVTTVAQTGYRVDVGSD
jgi:beta-RFAP synthase